MKVEHPLMSRFASGTLGHQLIFRRTPRAHAAYLHFKPKQPDSRAQQNWHILFARLANRWPKLDQAAKDFWLVESFFRRISPYNAYLNYNLRSLNPAQPEGLIGWWPNLVPEGNTLHDLCATTKDGEFVDLDPDAAWIWSAHRNRYVIEYSGAGYINIPDPPSTTGAYTWACWFKQNAYTGGSAIVDTGAIGRYVQCRFAGQRATHNLRGIVAYTPQMFLTDFTWHHYAGTWDTKQLQIYIDGVLHHTLDQLTAPEPQTTMLFGVYGVGVPKVYFAGQVGDLRFYDRDLTQPQIAELA